MCGLAGIALLDGGRPGADELALVRAMCAAQGHRGPDDRGAEARGSVCLGSVRLSILDLSSAGRMPMQDASGRFTITYNGELYNYRELREELVALGRAFRSGTDTEVVLQAFAEWGEASLARLSGMFAFAIHDGAEDTLTLVRDRLGIKPLYYLERGGRLLFASEIKALRRAAAPLPLDRWSLLQWVLYQSVDAPGAETLLEGVRSLLPGQSLTLRAGKSVLRTWWDPAERIRPEEYGRHERAGFAAAVERVEAEVRRSVSRQLVSDVPVGVLLSGGLDSSLVSVLAAAERPLTAFHVSVSGRPEMDESPYAAALANHLGIRLVRHDLDAREFRRELPRAIELADLPLTNANSVAYMIVCRAARAEGVPVLLSGEGADELFGGYAWRYRRLRWIVRLRALLAVLPRKLREGLELAGMASAGLPVETRQLGEFLPLSVAVLDRMARREWRRRCEEAYAFVAGDADRAVLGAMLADLRDFLTPLLRRLDRMSMGSSVECRVPFLDDALVELALHLPLAFRVGRRSDKRVLKTVARRHLDAALVERKKMGFPLPLADWLAPLARPELFRGGFWLETLGLDAAGFDDWLRGWRRSPAALAALVSSELWGRMTFMGSTVAELEGEIAALEERRER